MAKTKKAPVPTIRAKIIRRVYSFSNEDGTETHECSVVQVTGGQDLALLTNEVIQAHVKAKVSKDLTLTGVRDFTEEADVLLPSTKVKTAEQPDPEFVEEE